MKHRRLHVEGNAREQLLPLLRGRVFHVTCAANLDSIRSHGAILTDTDSTLLRPFGSYNSYFRNRGCVCVFDYRTISDEDLNRAVMNCSPWQPADNCSSALAFLFLSEAGQARLRPWEEWKTTRSFSEMVVPYAEAGYPGPIPFDEIDEIIEVTFERGPEHPFLAALRAPIPPR